MAISTGEIDVRKIVPQEDDNDIEALRKLRLAQMKGKAEAKKQWLALGHGKYERLEQESSFLEALPKHERSAGECDGLVAMGGRAGTC